MRAGLLALPAATSQNSGQTAAVKQRRSRSGQTAVKPRSNRVRHAEVKQRSNRGQIAVKQRRSRSGGQTAAVKQPSGQNRQVVKPAALQEPRGDGEGRAGAAQGAVLLPAAHPSQ